jgi:hypothetical protein
MVVWKPNCVCVTDCTLQLRVSLHKRRRVLYDVQVRFPLGYKLVEEGTIKIRAEQKYYIQCDSYDSSFSLDKILIS